MTTVSRSLALGLLLLVPLSAEAYNPWRAARASYYYYPSTSAYYYYPATSYYYPTTSYYYYPTRSYYLPASFYYPATSYYYSPATSYYYYPEVVPVRASYYYYPQTVSVPVVDPTPVYVAPATPVSAPAPTETRSNYAPATRVVARPAEGNVRVSFWNQSSRDLTLRIDGQTRTLERGRGLTLELPRQFTWQIDDRAEEVERVPDGKSVLELLIQR